MGANPSQTANKRSRQNTTIGEKWRPWPAVLGGKLPLLMGESRRSAGLNCPAEPIVRRHPWPVIGVWPWNFQS